MNDPRIALRDLAAPGVDLQWFEAVAVTLGMAETWPEGAQRVPPFEAYTLSAGGAVRPVPGVPFSSSPAHELGVALQALLVDRAAPQALRDAAEAAAQAPPGFPPAPHVRALTYFERPDRARLLVFLAQRAVPDMPDVDAEAELRKLAERARERAAHERPPGTWSRVPAAVRAGWQRWRPVLPALALLVAVLAGGAFVYRSPAAHAAASAPFARLATWLRPAPQAEPPSVEAGPEASPPKAAASRAPVAAADEGSPAAAAAGGDAAASAPLDPPSADVGQSEVSASGQPALPPILAMEMTPAADVRPAADTGVLVEGVGRVYREGDPGVEPARIGRRYLPADVPPGVPPERTGVFELVVDELGQVERVRLLSADNRYQERMLLSAAKAWRFEPARKDGVPVKFLTQVKVTW